MTADVSQTAGEPQQCDDLIPQSSPRMYNSDQWEGIGLRCELPAGHDGRHECVNRRGVTMDWPAASSPVSRTSDEAGMVGDEIKVCMRCGERTSNGVHLCRTSDEAAERLTQALSRNEWEKLQAALGRNGIDVTWENVSDRTKRIRYNQLRGQVDFVLAEIERDPSLLPADVVAGIRQAAAATPVRILWRCGICQAEIAPALIADHLESEHRGVDRYSDGFNDGLTSFRRGLDPSLPDEYARRETFEHRLTEILDEDDAMDVIGLLFELGFWQPLPVRLPDEEKQ